MDWKKLEQELRQEKYGMQKKDWCFVRDAIKKFKEFYNKEKQGEQLKMRLK
jgi:hypothetical protein